MEKIAADSPQIVRFAFDSWHTASQLRLQSLCFHLSLMFSGSARFSLLTIEFDDTVRSVNGLDSFPVGLIADATSGAEAKYVARLYTVYIKVTHYAGESAVKCILGSLSATIHGLAPLWRTFLRCQGNVNAPKQLKLTLQTPVMIISTIPRKRSG